jgi:hypothetical protein
MCLLTCIPCTALRKDTYGVFSEPVDAEEVSSGAQVLSCFQMGAQMLRLVFLCVPAASRLL